MTDKNPLAHYSGVLSEAVRESAAADVPTSGAAALSEYLATCEQHTIVPDVGGAFAYAFAAGFNLAASLATPDKRTDLVPGVMRCAKCEFQLVRQILAVNLGEVFAGDSKTEPCPNGCGPLWPVTWKQYAEQAMDAAETMADRAFAAEKEVKQLRGEANAPQAAPAAVAVPDLQDMLRELRVQIHKITAQLQPTVDCSGVWMAHDKMSAALATTPAAAAPGQLGDHMQIRCRKCGEQATVEFNSDRIITHNPHTGKPRDARDIASDPEGKLIVAPGPLVAAPAAAALLLDFLPFSARSAIAARHRMKVTAEFNALVREVIAEYRARAVPSDFAAAAPVVLPEWEKVRRGLTMVMLGLAGRPDCTESAIEAALDAVTEPGMPLAGLRAALLAGVSAPAAVEVDIADLVTGMSVSVDVSTGDDDAGNRYFGTVTVAQEDAHEKHGLTLLVQDAKPNFAPQAQADARDAEQEVLMEHSGCGSNTQVDMLTVRLNPGDKVVMHKGRITQGFDRANRAAIAAAKGE